MTKKTKKEKNPEHSRYNFPIKFTWGPSVDVQSRLVQLNQLKESGLINREEVAEKSRAILNGLNK